MTQRSFSWHHLVVLGAVSVLGACAQTQPMSTQAAAVPMAAPVVSNPPPQAPTRAMWHRVTFSTDSSAIDENGKKVIGDVVAYLKANPSLGATIVGRADAVGTAEYNMRLSHQRADAVRDALVYNGSIPSFRVETRWTGESVQTASTVNPAASAADRVVDIAIH